MAVYAYGNPDPEERWGTKKFVYDSLVNQNISRFMWSWFDNCDLNRLKNVPPNRMSPDERESWSHGHRLLDFQPGDWVIHKHVPEYGKMTAARLSSVYFYQAQVPYGNGRQCFHVDKVFTFDKNDERVYPLFRAKLNVMGAMYRIRDEKEFYESLYELGYKFDDADYEAARAVSADIFPSVTSEQPSQTVTDTSSSQTVVKPFVAESIADVTVPRTKGSFLEREFKQILGDITTKIQHNHPGKDLEGFLAEVFRRIPGVTGVKENGSGWGPDYGADLIVKYNIERIKGVELEEQTWVVQVKSYTDKHDNTNGVDQLRMAIEKFDATLAILVTTGERTQTLETAFNNLADEMSKKKVAVHLIAGVEVAQFVLRYGLDLLI